MFYFNRKWFLCVSFIFVFGCREKDVIGYDKVLESPMYPHKFLSALYITGVSKASRHIRTAEKRDSLNAHVKFINKSTVLREQTSSLALQQYMAREKKGVWLEIFSSLWSQQHEFSATASYPCISQGDDFTSFLFSVPVEYSRVAQLPPSVWHGGAHRHSKATRAEFIRKLSSGFLSAALNVAIEARASKISI